jgi:hypothetical protein
MPFGHALDRIKTDTPERNAICRDHLCAPLELVDPGTALIANVRRFGDHQLGPVAAPHKADKILQSQPPRIIL